MADPEFQKREIIVRDADGVSYTVLSDGSGRIIVVSATQTPLIMEEQFNQAYATPADICAADLVPTADVGIFRIYCVFDAVGDLYVRRDQGGVWIDEYLNDHQALVADAAYIFDIIVDANDDGINFRYSANAQILKFVVVEIEGMIG